LIENTNSSLTIQTQCELLELPRSSFYYKKIENPNDKIYMDLIDKIYTDRPYFGVRRIQDTLLKKYGLIVNHKKVYRLMRKMGIVAIYPKKNLSKPDKGHTKFPYLLKAIEISRPNQVWGTDISYIRMKEGWIYIVAVIDWYSRYVVSYELSTTLEIDFCIKAIREAYKIEKAEILNSDQGSQFTSEQFLSIPMGNDTEISMDSTGRALDNIFTERFWRTLKYEDIYIKDYETVAEAKRGINDYMYFYNNERSHSSLEYQTPAEVYFGTNILSVKNISKKS
jgi:putative transposase